MLHIEETEHPLSLQIFGGNKDSLVEDVYKRQHPSLSKYCSKQELFSPFFKRSRMGALGKRIDYFFSNWFIRNSRSKPVYPFRIRCDALVFCPNRNERAKCFLERTTFWAEVDYQPSLYDSSPAAVLWCIEYLSLIHI